MTPNAAGSRPFAATTASPMGPQGLSGAGISIGDFQRFRDYFYKRTGVQFRDRKADFVEKRILACMAAAKERSFAAWFARIRLDGEEHLFEDAVSRLMIHETYFHREEYQFDALVRDALPQLVRHRPTSRPLRILSLGSATGEEPYSIAIWLTEHWPDLDRYDVEITGVDIDPAAISAARKGEYSDRSVARIRDPAYRRYFSPAGPGKHQLSPEIRAAVQLRVASIFDADQMRSLGTSDVVFCRNVLIYFDVLSTRRAAELIYSALVPGGFLFLGHSESMSRISPIFSPVRLGETHAYQRPGDGS